MDLRKYALNSTSKVPKLFILKYMLPVAILAGGLATRLRPITEKTPKSLIQVAGKPFIYHQLEYLRNEGIEKVILCVGYLHELIRSEVGNGSKFDLEIDYSYDGDLALGTGGSIKKALPLLGEYFYVLYGDSFLPIHFKAIENFYFKSQKSALMTILLNADQWDKSNVVSNGQLILEYNKKQPKPSMRYIDYGLGILSGRLFKEYKEGAIFDLADLYHDLSIMGELASFEVHERFYEIGSIEGLKETERYLSAI
jgi:MurNAc alpha-1-phosphate uridylyltransferase